MTDTNKTSIIVTMMGDSMDNGTKRSFIDGDILTCIEIDPQNIEEGRLYVIQSNGNTLVRRVTQCNDESHTLTPLNPSYKECELNKNDVQHIYSIKAYQCKTTND